MSHSPTQTPNATPDPAEPLRTVLLWSVTGATGEYYATKLQAEVRARVLFPIEDPDTRYARVYFTVFYTGECND